MATITTFTLGLADGLRNIAARAAAAYASFKQRTDGVPADLKFTDSVERDLCDREYRRLYP